MKKSIVYALVLLCSLIACDDNTGTLGNSITPGADSIKVQTNTYQATSRSIKIDSVLSKSDKIYLGRFTDPETNSVIEADFIAQFYCGEGGNVFPPADSVKGDCALRVELRLFFTNIFGDSTNTMTAEVYELESTLQEGAQYYTNIDPTLFYDVTKKPIATTAYTAIDYTLDDDELNDKEHYANVCIPLPTEKGSEIIALYRSNPEYFINSAQFIEHVCKGYYVKTAGGDGTILYVDQAALNVYFQHSRTDSIFVTQFVGTQEVLQVNLFDFDSSQLQPLIDDTTGTYLKTPAGIFTEVTLPIAEITENNDSINSAKIIFQRYNAEMETKYPFGTPEGLLMLRKNDMHSFFEKNSLTNSTTSYYTTYNSTFNRYEFSNIARLISHCANEREAWIEAHSSDFATMDEAVEAYATQHPDWDKVVLVPVTTITDANKNIVNFRHDFKLNSAKLVGNKDKIDIKVITSKFNQ